MPRGGVRALNDAEQRLVRRVRAGLPVRFDRDGDRREIRAKLVRRLVLARDGRQRPRNRIVIESGRITGRLDLRDIGGAGDGAQSLEFRDCSFAGGIDLENARLRSLVLRGCRLPALHGRNCRVDGDIDLRELSMLDPERGECHVHLGGARIGGTLKAGGAHLRITGRPQAAKEAEAGAETRYALDLRRAVVHGATELQPGFRAQGGVNLAGARLHGDVWAMGAQIEAVEGDALNAQGLRAGGAVLLCSDPGSDGHLRTVVRGPVNLFTARVGSILDLRGSRFEFRTAQSAQIADGDAGGLKLSRIRVAGDVAVGDTGFGRAYVEGSVNLAGARMASLWLENLDITEHLQATGAHAAGSVHVNDAVVYGHVFFDHARIAQDFSIAVSRVRGRLGGHRLRAGGSVSLAGVLLGSEASFVQADVEGSFTLRQVRLPGGTWHTPAKLDLQDARVGGELKVAGLDSGSERVGRETGRVLALRQRALHCYPGWVLVEAKVDAGLARHLCGSHARVPDAARVVGMLVRAHQAPVGAGLRAALGGLLRSAGSKSGGENAAVVLLPGDASALHEFNRRGTLQLNSDAQAEDYLRLFCSYVWAGHGSFRIISPRTDARLHRALQAGRARVPGFAPSGGGAPAPDGARATPEERTRAFQIATELPDLQVTRIETGQAIEYRARATVLYGSIVYEATLAIYPDGMPVMQDHSARLSLQDSEDEYTLKPVRFVVTPGAGADDDFPASVADSATAGAPAGPPVTRATASAAGLLRQPSLEHGRFVAVTGAAFPRAAARTVRPILDPPPARVCLRDARVDRLDDEDGLNWHGNLRLELDGFVYARAPLEPAPDWSEARKYREPMIALRRADDFERAAMSATGARRRPLAGLDGWFIVEITTVVNLAPGGDDIGSDRTRHAVVEVVWRPRASADRDPRSGRGTVAAQDDGATADEPDREDAPASATRTGNVLPLQRIGPHPGAFEQLARSAPDATAATHIGNVATAADHLRLRWLSGVDGPRRRVIDAADPLLAAIPTFQRGMLMKLGTLRNFEIMPMAAGAEASLTTAAPTAHGSADAAADAGNPAPADAETADDRANSKAVSYRFRCTLFDGKALRGVDGVLRADGGLLGVRETAPVTLPPQFRERRIGPLRVLDAPGLVASDAVRASAWNGFADAAPGPPSAPATIAAAARAADAGAPQPPPWEPLAGLSIAMLLGDLLPLLRASADESAPKYHEQFALETDAVPPRNGVRESWRRALAIPALRPARTREATRLRWLARQYPDRSAGAASYRPHPYEVAAAAFRNEGANRSAREVVIEKLRIEAQLQRNPLSRFIGHSFGVLFGFGLSTARAFASTALLLLLGWAGTAYLNDRGLLVVDLAPAATVLVRDASAGVPGAVPLEVGSVVEDPARVETYVRCGRFASSFVYAADVMVPILEFGHARRCQIASTRPPGVTAAHLAPWVWQAAQSIYSVLGAVCVALTILTVSGVLRRRAES